MEIRDYYGTVVSSSSVVKYKNENFVLRQTPIAGGIFAYYEDYSSLNIARKKLATVNEKLKQNNEFLMQKSKVNEKLYVAEAEKSAYDRIDKVLNSGTKKISLLLEKIKDGNSEIKLMVRINITACTVKRECMLLINALYEKHQAINGFLNSVAEMKEFISPINLKITVGCTVSGNLETEKNLLMYRLFSSAVERAAILECQNILVQLYEKDGNIEFSILSDKELFEQEEFEKLYSEMVEKNCKLTDKLWDDTKMYLLSFKKEVEYV